ncbi:MAG TPA: ACP S-malonyltransferase [Candidatus Acidoferrales bacterium]|nr:ACP S-malonyltransferase [Candidatus Acidoferrales bacterium]
MAGIALIFPGQGSQLPGMGAELLADPELEQLARSCSWAAGVDLHHLLVDATEDELRLTQNAQPALLFVGMGLTRLLRRRGVVAVASAGHSVGEYAALDAAGAASSEDLMLAVAERGRGMALAAPPQASSMRAVLGISAAAVEGALKGLPEVWPANYNTPTQTVIGGTLAGLEGAEGRLIEAGARRILPLNVAAAFHTPLMVPAANRLREVLDRVGWEEPVWPVVANLTGRVHPGPESFAKLLQGQLSQPVRWADSVAQLLALGADVFLELGPRRALTGMMKELAPAARAQTVASPGAVAELDLDALLGAGEAPQHPPGIG